MKIATLRQVYHKRSISKTRPGFPKVIFTADKNHAQTEAVILKGEDSVIPVLTTDERDKTDLFLFALEKHEGIASINPFYRFYPWLFQLPNAL